MLEPYADRIRVVELEAGGEPSEDADVALYDTFAGRRHSLERAEKMVVGQIVRHVVLYTWDAPAEFLEDASRIGVSGVVLKSRGAADLVDAIERVTSGERVGLDVVSRGREQRSPPDLSMREREVLALVALGMSNREVADELYLSVDTVKTYVRRLYSKLGVRNRTQAALRAAGYDVQPPVEPTALDRSPDAVGADDAGDVGSVVDGARFALDAPGVPPEHPPCPGPREPLRDAMNPIQDRAGTGLRERRRPRAASSPNGSTAWRPTAGIVDDFRLAASELVTNAVEHGNHERVVVELGGEHRTWCR